MADTKHITDSVLDDYLGTMKEGFNCSPEHDAYLRAEVNKALEDEKKNGADHYHDLRVVAEKFGYNAR